MTKVRTLGCVVVALWGCTQGAGDEGGAALGDGEPAAAQGEGKGDSPGPSDEFIWEDVGELRVGLAGSWTPVTLWLDGRQASFHGEGALARGIDEARERSTGRDAPPLAVVARENSVEVWGLLLESRWYGDVWTDFALEFGLPVYLGNGRHLRAGPVENPAPALAAVVDGDAHLVANGTTLEDTGGIDPAALGAVWENLRVGTIRYWEYGVGRLANLYAVAQVGEVAGYATEVEAFAEARRLSTGADAPAVSVTGDGGRFRLYTTGISFDVRRDFAFEDGLPVVFANHVFIREGATVDGATGLVGMVDGAATLALTPKE